MQRGSREYSREDIERMKKESADQEGRTSLGITPSQSRLSKIDRQKFNQERERYWKGKAKKLEQK